MISIKTGYSLASLTSTTTVDDDKWLLIQQSRIW